MNEQFTIIFDQEQQVTIVTCLGCDVSIKLDYRTISETSDRAIEWGHEHAFCVAKERIAEEQAS